MSLTTHLARAACLGVALAACAPEVDPSAWTGSSVFTLALPLESGPEPVTLAYEGETVVPVGGTARLAARLTGASGAPVVGRRVTFAFSLASTPPISPACAASTDLAGRARCEAQVPQPSGRGTLATRFAGDAFHASASAVAPLVAYEQLASGSFVIGDGDAIVGQDVVFWGARWWSDNSVSGGDAPPSFRGFVPDPGPGLPGCGGRWTASFERKATPPEAVPRALAVLAASAIERTGTTLRGDIARVAIVETGDGFTGDPATAGTGKVLAVLCGE